MFGNWGEMRSCCSQLDGGGWSRVERRKCKRAHSCCQRESAQILCNKKQEKTHIWNRTFRSDENEFHSASGLQACPNCPKRCPRTPHWGRGSKGSNYGGGFVQVRIVGRGELAGWGKCLNPRNWIRHRSIMTGSRRNSAGIMIGIGKGFDTEVPKNWWYKRRI